MGKKPGTKVTIIHLEEACLWLENHGFIKGDSEDVAGTVYGWLEDNGLPLHDHLCQILQPDDDLSVMCYDGDIDALFEHFADESGNVWVEGY